MSKSIASKSSGYLRGLMITDPVSVLSPLPVPSVPKLLETRSCVGTSSINQVLFTFIKYMSLVLLVGIIYTINNTQQLPPNKLNEIPHPAPTDTSAARFGIFIQSTGNVAKTMGALRDLYHPLNSYAIHVDIKAPEEDLRGIREALKNDAEIQRNGNVVLMKPTSVTYLGITSVTNILSGMNTLLRLGEERGVGWDFFTHISTSDQRMLSIENIMDVFGNVPRRINFMDGHLAEKWFVEWRFQHAHVDRGMWGRKMNKTVLEKDHEVQSRLDLRHYDDLVNKQLDIMKAKLDYYEKIVNASTAMQREEIEIPKLAVVAADEVLVYKGSAWMVLCRGFVEYVARARTSHPINTLALLSRSEISDESYFQTVAMGSPEWRDTIANGNLRFDIFGNPFTGKRCGKGTHACSIIPEFIPLAHASGALLARKFDLSNYKSRHAKEIIEKDIRRGSPEHLKNVCGVICHHLDNMGSGFKNKYVDMNRRMHSKECGTCEQFKKHPKGDPSLGERVECTRGCSTNKSCQAHCIPRVVRPRSLSSSSSSSQYNNHQLFNGMQNVVAMHDGTGRILCRSGLFPEQPALRNPFWDQQGIRNEPQNVCELM
eukprot:Nk52_evm2s1636 gene=Nk52_evmTU2s1636